MRRSQFERQMNQDSETCPKRGIEICILAGGRSSRMGLDKARIRLGTRSLLGHARALVRAVGKPARVIRRDLVRRSGPLGGVCTALLTTHADTVVFLSCDMPFVLPETVQTLVRESRRARTAVFAECDGIVGFPFLIRRSALPLVLQQLAAGRLSLQTLASVLRAKSVRVARRHAGSLININTPEELKLARRIQRAQDCGYGGA
jgi:molybdopterin-guanine dinucleotide biosynthesis protein A